MSKEAEERTIQEVKPSSKGRGFLEGLEMKRTRVINESYYRLTPDQIRPTTTPPVGKKE